MISKCLDTMCFNCKKYLGDDSCDLCGFIYCKDHNDLNYSFKPYNKYQKLCMIGCLTFI